MADKNVNFPWVISPAASLVWSPNTTDFARISFSSALRNPTLADQYLFLDVGPATLMGNLNGAQGLYTVQSFLDYRNSFSGGNITGNLDTLVQFDISPIRPEQVRTFEFGYRTTTKDKLYVDAGAILAVKHFIGYNLALILVLTQFYRSD